MDELLDKEMGSQMKTDIARATVNLFFNSIIDTIKTGERVELRGFGTFTPKDYEGYTGRNPKTGEQVVVKPKRLFFSEREQFLHFR